MKLGGEGGGDEVYGKCFQLFTGKDTQGAVLKILNKGIVKFLQKL